MEQEVPNEFLLVLDDGDLDVKEFVPASEIMPSQPRTKGAYYKNIERKMLLKKKRVNVRNLPLPSLFNTNIVLHLVIRPDHEEVAYDQSATYKDGR